MNEGQRFSLILILAHCNDIHLFAEWGGGDTCNM